MHEREGLTPVQAAAAIREMEGMDEVLKARVHGLTWLFWAVVSPAIFLTYAFAAAVVHPSHEARWLGLLWMPWAAVGLTFTLLLWRSIGFVLPGARLGVREVSLHAALFLLATVGLVIASFWTGFDVYPPIVVLLGIGLATSVLGVREAVAARGRSEAIAQTVIGVALMAFAVSEAGVLGSGLSLAGLSQAALWNAGASGVALAGIGILRVMRA